MQKFRSYEEFYEAAKAMPENEGVSDKAIATAWLKNSGDLYDDSPPGAEKGFVSDTGTALKSGWFEVGASMREVGRALLPQPMFDAIDSLDGNGATPDEREARRDTRDTGPDGEQSMCPTTSAARG